MAKTSKKTKTSKRYVPRQTRKFQLRRDHPIDAHVTEILDYARSQRREVTLIRDSVMLFWALENGNLDALFEKFPQYKAQLTSSAPVGGNSGGGHSELAKEIAAQIVLMGGSNYVMQSALPPAPAKPTLPLKTYPTKTAVSSADITANMLDMFD